MISLHHTHLFASDVDATIRFWRDHFGAQVIMDAVFAGARNVFMRVGEGRLHLYDQHPKHAGAGTVHHLGIETSELGALVTRLKTAGISVTDVRCQAEADYAMAQGPDGLLLELFEPHAQSLPAALVESGYFATLRAVDTAG